MQARRLLHVCLVLAGVSVFLVACSKPAQPLSSGGSTPGAEAQSAATSPTPELKPDRWAQPPVVSDDPAMLAEQLTVAERAVRDLAVSGAELAWKAQLQQKVYRRLVERPDLHPIVLAALPDDVREPVRKNLDASLDLRAMVSRGRQLPAWRIVEPAPAEELLAFYHQAEAEFGIPWTYLASIHLIETVMGRIRGTSVAGAQGPMQFMPATWQAYGQGDVNDNRDAIRAAARYLRAGGGPANMAKALFSYNPSDRYVRAVTAYAEVMRAAPEAFRGYYHWQVYYLTVEGDVHLPVGYAKE